MSRLTELVRRVEQENPALGQELGQEIKALLARRSFGLNFERHMPESVELPERTVRRGDKVRFRAPRGVADADVEQRVWRVTRIEGRGEARTAHLAEYQSAGEPERVTRPTADLVVIAEFRDPIYPGLRSTGKVERGGGKPYHAVINGENYHALEALAFAYEGRVDCMYLDPPFNSGSRVWKYNNDYVDSEDVYRHSKWLAMMERRLRIARKLLKLERSVLILAIDENEVHRLVLLLEQIFSSSKIQMVTVLINPAGASIIDQFSRVDEHLLFVHIGSARPMRTITDTTPGTSTFVDEDGKQKPFQWEPFQRSGGNSRRQDTKAKFFPVYVDEALPRIVGCGDSVPFEVDRETVGPAPHGCVQVWPIKQDGTEACWQLSPETFRRYLADGRIKLGRRNSKTGRWSFSFLTKGHMRAIADGELVVTGRDQQGTLVVENAEGRLRSQVGKTMWTNGAYSATEYGSSLLRRIIPKRKFPFPKSLYAVEDALRYYVGANPNALILDFFAGSGTTAHAVMRLNRQDGGHRRSISVTNNEVSAEEATALRALGLRPGDPEWDALGICEYITKPRISAAVSGLTPEGEPIRGDYRFRDEFPMAEGFDENVEFFDLTYEDPERIRHDLAFAAIAPLLWMRAGSEGARIEAPNETFALAATYGVLFNLDAAAGFVQAAAKAEQLRVAYIVTDDEKQYQIIADALPERVETVRLYEAYLRTFQVSGGED
jgi:adenine-specific DNA-methyltransferase